MGVLRPSGSSEGRAEVIKDEATDATMKETVAMPAMNNGFIVLLSATKIVTPAIANDSTGFNAIPLHVVGTPDPREQTDIRAIRNGCNNREVTTRTTAEIDRAVVFTSTGHRPLGLGWCDGGGHRSRDQSRGEEKAFHER
jgi:hypothetical protein